MELTFHDGTVRDLVFMQDTSNRSSLLISGGAGDCKIYVTDCETGTPIRVMSGHSGMCKNECNFLQPEESRNAKWYAVENLVDVKNMGCIFLNIYL